MSVTKVRRVVTGQKPDGASVLTHVEEVDCIRRANGLLWYGVWGWDQQPRLPHAVDGPFDVSSVFPAPGGLRINTVVFPPRFNQPGATGSEEATDDYAKLENVPGGKRVGKGVGMHITDSVDFGFITSGEIITIQEDGSEETLRPGDVYVQNGAMHAWRNDTDEPCMVTFVVIGTERDGK